MTPDFGEVAAGKPYRRGCLQIVGQPRPVVRGDCDFSFGSSLFVLGRIAGIRAAPPSLGEKADPDFCCGCEASFCRTVAVRTAVVLQGILSECFSAFPIPTMFRGGGSMRCAMPAGKPHSAAECRSPKFVQFRRRWTLSSSERPLKYIKGYLG